MPAVFSAGTRAGNDSKNSFTLSTGSSIVAGRPRLSMRAAVVSRRCGRRSSPPRPAGELVDRDAAARRARGSSRTGPAGSRARGCARSRPRAGARSPRRSRRRGRSGSAPSPSRWPLSRIAGPSFGDADARDDRAHPAHLEHELGAELVDVAARGEVDVRGRHVDVVERLEERTRSRSGSSRST